ncbi:MAG: hypothetical protein H6818_20880 [Phycisphaerales bacterium]|nr:hypothetical protein [Phycisphaerales bacterium]MCB9862246.1 hypothetical protein [Phycisphaerales bacterium]
MFDSMEIDKPYAGMLQRAGLGSVSSVLHCEGDCLAAWSRTTDVIRCDPAGEATSVYVKRYHYPRWRHRFKGMFRGTLFRKSRARSEYHALRLMRRLGIQAVRPVAYGERRILLFVRSCFLITEAVPDAMPLSAFIQKFGEHRGTPRSVEIRREILVSLARQVRHMHDAGFVHRDLFWRNVLIRCLPGDRFEFYFLDASVGRWIRMRRRRDESIVADIAAMGAAAPNFCSKADQLRFLLEYLGVKTLDPENRAWLRRVQTQSDLLRPSELERLRRGRVFAQADAEPVSAE